MALHDLTPNLRTRLSRVERLVGVFVFLAVLLLLSGIIYYLYHTARRKGWFLERVPYFTMISDASGLKVGDPVRLMGFTVGMITEIETMPPESVSPNNVYIKFNIQEPYYGYLWDDSKVKVTGGELLGNRVMQVTKGTKGIPTVQETNKVSFGRKRAVILGIFDDKEKIYKPLAQMQKGYYLPPDEGMSYSDRLEELAGQIERALPAVFSLTNKIEKVLNNASDLTLTLNSTVQDARPILTNLTAITDRLQEPDGSLGKWLLPEDLRKSLHEAMASANTLLTNADHQITTVATDLDKSLEELAAITKSLRVQVEGNTNVLSSISKLVVETDDMVQGLKRHWFVRSAFKKKGGKNVPKPPRERGTTPGKRAQ